jgi:hypothetical protein
MLTVRNCTTAGWLAAGAAEVFGATNATVGTTGTGNAKVETAVVALGECFAPPLMVPCVTEPNDTVKLEVVVELAGLPESVRLDVLSAWTPFWTMFIW